MKLDIGCGEFKKDGFVGVDIVPGSDVVAPMWKLPFPDASVSYIYVSHALEHIPKAKVKPTLIEWHRVLTESGTLEIIVPDLMWVCKNFLRFPDNEWSLDAIFGNQEHSGQFHQTGFTKARLEKVLLENNFSIFKIETIWSHEQDSLRAVCLKI